MSLIEKKISRLESKLSFLKSLLRDLNIPKSIQTGIQNALHGIEKEIIELKTIYTLTRTMTTKGWILRWLANGLYILDARLFRLNVAYTFLKSHSYQRQDPDFKFSNSIIDQYLKELCKLSQLNQSEIIHMISHSYSCLPLGEIHFYPVFLPAYDLESPNYWGILAHELGHIYYDTRREQIQRKLLPQINQIVRQEVSKLVSDAEAYPTSRDAAFIWIRWWTPEYFSDCFATRILGPAYLAMSNIELFIESTEETETFPPSHPPTRTRISLCLETLRKLNLDEMKPYIEHLENEFKEIAKLPTTETEISRKLEIFTHRNILPQCFELIERTVDVFSIRELWPEVLAAMEKLKANGKIDRRPPLLPQICAATLSEKRIQLHS
jgi:hypothetical protein